MRVPFRTLTFLVADGPRVGAGCIAELSNFSRQDDMNFMELKMLIDLALSGKLLSPGTLYWRNRVRLWFRYFCATRLQHLKFKSVQYRKDEVEISPSCGMKKIPWEFRTKFCCLLRNLEEA